MCPVVVVDLLTITVQTDSYCEGGKLAQWVADECLALMRSEVQVKGNLLSNKIPILIESSQSDYEFLINSVNWIKKWGKSEFMIERRCWPRNRWENWQFKSFIESVCHIHSNQDHQRFTKSDPRKIVPRRRIYILISCKSLIIVFWVVSQTISLQFLFSSSTSLCKSGCRWTISPLVQCLRL